MTIPSQSLLICQSSIFFGYFTQKLGRQLFQSGFAKSAAMLRL
jgi:hypothetical protein